jgi:hypothetical protein
MKSIAYKVLFGAALVLAAVEFVHFEDNIIANQMFTNAALEKLAGTQQQLLQLQREMYQTQNPTEIASTK